MKYTNNKAIIESILIDLFFNIVPSEIKIT